MDYNAIKYIVRKAHKMFGNLKISSPTLSSPIVRKAHKMFGNP